MAISSCMTALQIVNEAMREGDRKYGENAWRDKPAIADPTERMADHVSAVERHLKRYTESQEPIDRDSGLPALAHVVARALIALQTGINEGLVKPPMGMHSLDDGP